jgi:hypothetical protein
MNIENKYIYIYIYICVWNDHKSKPNYLLNILHFEI